MPLVKSNKQKPFKFANFVTLKKEFIPLVKAAWKEDLAGYSMFKVVQKLKKFKPSVRKLMWKDGNVYKRVKTLQHELDLVQIQLYKDPDSSFVKMKVLF